jgi:Ca2+-binding EF-hand superfamily protein
MKALDMNPTEDELKKMIREVDLNMNGKIEFDEFLLLMQRKIQMGGDDETELKNEFATFDQDHNGQISPSELKKIMDGLGKAIYKNLCYTDIGVGERLSEHEIAEMIQAADEDGNGEISFPGELRLSY